MKHPFDDVEIKCNAPELLEKALKSKKKRCMITTGFMTDSYLPLEEIVMNTRKCLDIINRYEFGIAIQTKSNLILRDIDLLKEINNKTKCVVQMTLTTYDDELCKKIEPNVCTTINRYDSLVRFRDYGIPTIVWLSPLLPFINDTKENIWGILDYCIKANVRGVICPEFGVTLRDGNREYFYQKLDELFPGLKEKYIRTYGNQYKIISNNNIDLMDLFKEVCKKNNIMSDINQIFKYINEFPDCKEQLSLFDYF
jgi:DNA repair photolyase